MVSPFFHQRRHACHVRGINTLFYVPALLLFVRHTVRQHFSAIFKKYIDFAEMASMNLCFWV